MIIAGIRPLPSKTFKLYWRHGITGEWQRIQESQHDEETMIYQEPIIMGSGLHQFEIRTRDGADIFAIMETWPMTYLMGILCS